MQTYIAILRGINVSGQKIIKMVELKEHLASLGFVNLTTYIQSGNIVFQYDVEANKVLENKIHQNIQDSYGFDVPVIVRSKEEWQNVVVNSPFDTNDLDVKKIGVTFLKNTPSQVPIEDIAKYKAINDEVVYSDKEIYLYMPDGFGKSKLTNNVLERKLKVAATTRNWRTTQKLLEMAMEIG